MEEKVMLSESLLEGAGTDMYYQGSVGERMIIHEGNSYNEGNAWGYRELGVPYLKRGFAHEAYKYYQLAVENDPEEWAGYMAYCWLYFYRDYDKALALAEQCDAFTEDFIDYPQSTSVNFMRGICYLQMGKYDEAIKYLKMHLDFEADEVTHQYIDVPPFLLLGIAYYKNKDYVKADSIFTLGIEHNKGVADLYYYKAINKHSMDDYDAARKLFNESKTWFDKGGRIGRPYVEEFYAIYQRDLDVLANVLEID